MARYIFKSSPRGASDVRGNHHERKVHHHICPLRHSHAAVGGYENIQADAGRAPNRAILPIMIEIFARFEDSLRARHGRFAETLVSGPTSDGSAQNDNFSTPLSVVRASTNFRERFRQVREQFGPDHGKRRGPIAQQSIVEIVQRSIGPGLCPVFREQGLELCAP